ncbi:MAG TPA: hypothetical protein VF655_02440 [Allosphingosinicella sp.]|jgi:hypothetical protein
MSEPTIMLAMAGFGLFGLGIALAAALKGWAGWLELKRLELTTAAAGGHGHAAERPHGGAGDLIEVADLKERVRKLESIASCVDL